MCLVTMVLKHLCFYKNKTRGHQDGSKSTLRDTPFPTRPILLLLSKTVLPAPPHLIYTRRHWPSRELLSTQHLEAAALIEGAQLAGDLVTVHMMLVVASKDTRVMSYGDFFLCSCAHTPTQILTSTPDFYYLSSLCFCGLVP